MKLCLSCNERFDAQDWYCPGCGSRLEFVDGFLSFSPELTSSSDGFKEDFFDKLSELEGFHFWFESRNRLIQWSLEKYFPRVAKFMEIGCGTGFVLRDIQKKLGGAQVIGSEIFIKGLEHAQARLPGVTLVQADARRLPFSEEFDAIGAFDVIEHIEDDELVLSQMFQAVKSGGGILLIVPQHSFLWSEIDKYSCHVRRYRSRELKDKVEKAGFVVTRTTSFTSMLLPLMALSRLKSNLLGSKLDP